MKLSFTAVGALRVAKNTIKDGALTEESERILSEGGAAAAAEAGYQITPMEVPQSSERGTSAVQLQSIILTVLVATGGVYKAGKSRQSDLAAKLAKKTK